MLLDLTILGLAVTLEPFPITALILLLSTARGTRVGLAYVLSWMACLVVVVAATFIVTGGEPLAPKSAPSTAALVIKLLLGVLLVGIAVRQRRRIGQPHPPPTWMARLDSMSYGSAALLGTFLQPWSLVAAGAMVVLTSSVTGFWEYLTLVYFCLLSTATLLGIELYTVFRHEEAMERLRRLREWLDTHRDQAIVIISLVAGLWLMGNSLYLLVTA
jgi:uncharacterized membrane protein (DUF2068 family)